MHSNAFLTGAVIDSDYTLCYNHTPIKDMTGITDIHKSYRKEDNR